MKSALVAFLFLLTSSLLAQKMPAYQLFTAKGKKVSYKKMIKQLRAADIILFGEIHNDPIAHWLQLETAKSLAEETDLVMGAEMLETHEAAAYYAYITGEMNYKELEKEVDLWSNFSTDYKPLLDLAKTEKVPFVATNIPRKYASQVFKQGIESLEDLPEAEKAYIAPLPIAYDAELPGYKAMLDMMGNGHGGENFPKAQAIKDATMAHFILQNWREGKTFLHFNGTYHSQNFEGILWYLQKAKPNLKYVTIATDLQVDLSKLDADKKGLADFILIVPETMTRTY